MTMKVFLKVTLVSLTLRVSTIFYNFKKNAGNFTVLVSCAA